MSDEFFLQGNENEPLTHLLVTCTLMFFVKLKKEKLLLGKLSNVNKGRKNRIMNPVCPLSSFNNYQHIANIVP